MAVLKCKMCGGDLEVAEGMSVCECEYCGSKQTVPAVDDEKKITLFSRANRLRAGNEFDKAAGVFESIIADFPEEAEAYWGLVLCKYGIEYVDDPQTGKKVPTCHRSSFDSVMEDSDFEMVMEYSDAVSRAVYREEAKRIEQLRIKIIEVSSKEEPYDIFICYKESDGNGNRTIDSVLAQDVYDALKEKGYRVFFSRITLEDKLGQEYEPYIFAALNSAKVMLVFGTDYEYYNAVWVKNEWSRFLALMASGGKKVLIPCYKDIDAYDMPKEFKRLQAQDMGKVGAIQDLLRGIDKVMGKDERSTANAAVEEVLQSSGTSFGPLIKRTRLFVQEEKWDKADEYCERLLDMNPESGEAYWLKELVERKCKNAEELAWYYFDYEKGGDGYIRNSQTMEYARKYADSNLQTVLDQFDHIVSHGEENRKKEKKTDPRWDELRNKIVEARHRMDLLDDRVILHERSLFLINSSGEVKGRLDTLYTTAEIQNGLSVMTNPLTWKNMFKIYDSSEEGYILGITMDGSVRVGGTWKYLIDKKTDINKHLEMLKKMSKWTGIKRLVHGSEGWFGVSVNGKVLFASESINNYVDESVEKLNDIDDILNQGCPFSVLIFRKKDGTIVDGRNEPIFGLEEGQLIKVYFLLGLKSFVGIKEDGSLVIKKNKYTINIDWWDKMSEWSDIISLRETENEEGKTLGIIGLDAYGEIVGVGDVPCPVKKGVGDFLTRRAVKEQAGLKVVKEEAAIKLDQLVEYYDLIEAWAGVRVNGDYFLGDWYVNSSIISAIPLKSKQRRLVAGITNTGYLMKITMDREPDYWLEGLFTYRDKPSYQDFRLFENITELEDKQSIKCLEENYARIEKKKHYDAEVEQKRGVALKTAENRICAKYSERINQLKNKDFSEDSEERRKLVDEQLVLLTEESKLRKGIFVKGKLKGITSRLEEVNRRLATIEKEQLEKDREIADINKKISEEINEEKARIIARYPSFDEYSEHLEGDERQ